ncbi:MAG: DUF3097 domain-containing protein [Nocardioidaceae bacterium]
MPNDRYGPDVLSTDWRAPRGGRSTDVSADRGLVVEEVMTNWCGEIMRVDRDLDTVELEDRHGVRRSFPLGPGFLLEGAPVVLLAPARTVPVRVTRNASGSLPAPPSRAKVARASRIFVEGRHDAELVEKVWGDDLRIEGVVVEYLNGIDDLEEVLRTFDPAPGRRVGVLVDHLVSGSKESRIAHAVTASALGEHVMITGHAYVDVWQAVKPSCLGAAAWPTVPPGVSWKHGVCQQLGWPQGDQADIARAWKHILSRVSSYTDVEPALLRAVEQLIDFVTADG